MRRSRATRTPARTCWSLLVTLAGLAAAACGDINFQPTTPTWVFPGGGAGIRTLYITGSLTADRGTCLEARVLYDGRALPGSTVVCPDPGGCIRLDLSAETTTGGGRHTLSFQVVRQPGGDAVYVAEVSVRMTREGLGFVLPIRPDPVRATLHAGEVVSFRLDFAD